MYIATMPDKVAQNMYMEITQSILTKTLIYLIWILLQYMNAYTIFKNIKIKKGKLTKLGLYDLTQETGLAINGAAVQLLASRTSRTSTFLTLLHIMACHFVSESPEYYPLECALLSQMMFSQEMSHYIFSTLYGSPMFKELL